MGWRMATWTRDRVKVAVVDCFSPLVSDTSLASLTFFFGKLFVNVVKRGTNLEISIIRQYFVLGRTRDLSIGRVYGEIGQGARITLCKA